MIEAECIVAQPEAMLERLQKGARTMFQQQTEEILSQVPSTDMFNEIGFVDGKPVLVVSPFRVPPGPIRDAWVKKFFQLKEENRLEDLELLVYHYGSQQSSPPYSFVEAEKFLSFEQGKKLGYNLPSHGIMDKFVADEELTKEENLLLKPWREMTQDLHKEPLDRHARVFAEIYNLLTLSTPQVNLEVQQGSRIAIKCNGSWHQAVVSKIRQGFCFLTYLSYELEDEWLPIAEHEYRVISLEPLAVSTKDCILQDHHQSTNPKSPKKLLDLDSMARKRLEERVSTAFGSGFNPLPDCSVMQVEDAASLVSEESCIQEQHDTKGKKNHRIAKVDKKQEVALEDVVVEKESDEKAMKPHKVKNKKPLKKTSKRKISEGEDDFVADHGDRKDGKVKRDAAGKIFTPCANSLARNDGTAEDTPTVHDIFCIDDFDFKASDVSFETEMDVDSKAETKSSGLTRAKSAKTHNEAPTKKKSDVKHRIKPNVQTDRLEKAYNGNAKQFGPLLSKWETGLTNQDVDMAQACMRKVSQKMEDLVPVYAKESGITHLMKETKSLLKECGIDLMEYRLVWKRLRDMFATKVKELAKTAFKKTERKSGQFSETDVSKKKAAAKACEMPVSAVNKKKNGSMEVKMTNYLQAPIPRKKNIGDCWEKDGHLQGSADSPLCMAYLASVTSCKETTTILQSPQSVAIKAPHNDLMDVSDVHETPASTMKDVVKDGADEENTVFDDDDDDDLSVCDI